MAIEIVDFPIKNGGSFQFAMLVYQPTYCVYLKFSLDQKAFDGPRPPPDGCLGTQGDAGPEIHWGFEDSQRIHGAGIFTYIGMILNYFGGQCRNPLGFWTLLCLCFWLKKIGPSQKSWCWYGLPQKKNVGRSHKKLDHEEIDPINRDPARPNTIPTTMWGWMIPTISGNFGVDLFLLGLAHIWVNYNELTTSSLEIIVSKGELL